MSIFGFFIVLLLVLLGVAIAYDLRARRRRGLAGESRKARRQGAGRVEQDRRSDTRVRPDNIRNPDSFGGGAGDF